MGFEEIVDGSRVVLVEWGELVSAILPADRVVVSLRLADDNDDARVIDVSAQGSERSAALSAQLWSTLQSFSGAG